MRCTTIRGPYGHAHLRTDRVLADGFRTIRADSGSLKLPVPDLIEVLGRALVVRAAAWSRIPKVVAIGMHKLVIKAEPRTVYHPRLLSTAGVPLGRGRIGKYPRTGAWTWTAVDASHPVVRNVGDVPVLFSNVWLDARLEL